MTIQNFSRQQFLQNSSALLGGLLLTSFTGKSVDEKALVEHEIKVMEEMTDNAYSSLWNFLSGIDEKELDWKPNPESNSVRWIVGHLCWFEEWLADALDKRTGRYTMDTKALSYTDDSYEKIKVRFDTARKQTTLLTKSLTPEKAETELNYLKRFNIPIRYVLRIHVGHLHGHTYQIRYIRGTYSRVFKTDKTLFDPW